MTAVMPGPQVDVRTDQTATPFDKPETITVVVCAYTMARWVDLQRCITSLRAQDRLAEQIVVVIDHNRELFEAMRAAAPDCQVVENTRTAGLSGARNTGVCLAVGDVIAFLDDDAAAPADWTALLLDGFDAYTGVVGGGVEAVWSPKKPAWFPDEFNWVVGCSWIGLPTETALVRNVIGANMAFRREAFDTAGLFVEGIGRDAHALTGCEETELCIRLTQTLPAVTVRYLPSATIDHYVAANRNRPGYFVRRCWGEGISKALVSEHVGTASGLSRERTYVARVLPAGIAIGLRKAVAGEASGLLRAAAIIVGFGATTAGFFTTRISQQRRRHR